MRDQRQHARLVLIDLHWYEHTYGAISVAQVCKEELPNVLTVIGGLAASGFAKAMLESFPAVDFVIRGDAEIPLLALAQCVLAQEIRSGELPDCRDVPNLSYRRDGVVVENAQTYCASTDDLDRLDFADISFLEHADSYFFHEYIVTDLEKVRQAVDKSPFRGRWIATARGCKFECSYCGGCKSAHQTLAGRDGIVPRSPEMVVAELGRLAENSVTQASLSYDISQMGDRYWRRFFSLLRKSGVKIGLYNEFFQLPPDGFIKDFARSVDMEHSCLALSPLSGSERVRRLNGKRYSTTQFFDVLDYLNLHNVSIFVYFLAESARRRRGDAQGDHRFGRASLRTLPIAAAQNSEYVPHHRPAFADAAASGEVWRHCDDEKLSGLLRLLPRNAACGTGSAHRRMAWF